MSSLPLAIDPYVTDWLDLLIRWLHVIAAIAWIGTSFYFVLLDQSLRFPKDVADREAGVGGELWEVHGGGFYHVQKYRVAPNELPDHLAWFKWEAYTTWLSGFGLMVVLYYLNAHTYLIDPTVADLRTWEAVTISVALLAAAWVVYDALCRLLGGKERDPRRLHPRADGDRRLGRRPALRAPGSVPPGRGDAGDDHGRQRRVQHHPGALGADPGEAGRSRARPGARPRCQAALRPQQLPDAAGVVHDDRRPLRVHLRRRPRVARPDRLHAARGVGAAVLQPSPRGPDDLGDSRSRCRRGGRARRLAAAGLGRLEHQRARSRSPASQSIVAARCAPCHSLEPTQAGFSSPPAGVVLETPAQIVAQASRIRTVVAHEGHAARERDRDDPARSATPSSPGSNAARRTK